MKLKVSAKNEYKFVPEIGGNRNAPESEKFVVIMRRLNQTLNNARWTSFGKNGEVYVDIRKTISDHIVRLINPPLLQTSEGNEIELTIDILLSDTYPELDQLIEQIAAEVNRLAVTRETKDVKK
jgi:hypothetical protein